MKILQVMAGSVWGGAEQYVLDLGRALEAQGHTVGYLTRESEAVKSRLDREGIAYTGAAPDGWLDRRGVRRLARLITDGEYDIVHVHSMSHAVNAVMAKQLSGREVKVVATRHVAHRTALFPLFRRYFRQLHRLVFVSEFAKRSWLGKNRWMDEDRCSVVLNSVPEAAAPHEGSPLRQILGVPAETAILLFAGRVRKSKGVETLLRAAARLGDRDFAVAIIGAPKNDKYQQHLTALATGLGVETKVHLLGFHPEARRLMGEATIGVSPSIVRESFGLVNTEFMQAGVPVVTTDNGAQPEYITDGENGLLVPPDNPEALAEALAQLLDDAPLRQRIGAAGKRNYYENLSYSKFVDKMTETYK